MKQTILTLLFALIVSPAAVFTQERPFTDSTDPNLSNNQYRIWIDAGIYPIWGASHESAFYPTFNVRAGLGKSFSLFQLYGFAELTKHRYDNSDNNSFYKTSDSRTDIALYGMGSFADLLFLGVGIYHSHQDNIVTHQFRYPDTTYDSGVRSYNRIYYILGVGRQISISESISLPIGLYYRNQDYSDRYVWLQKISLRCGVMYKF